MVAIHADPAVLVSSKITLPLRKPLVTRLRLFERLDQGLEKKLTLISAPAGFGKTMLLCDWAAYRKIPLAWISLEESDNDPARFMVVLLAAVEKILPGFSEMFAPGLQSPPGTHPQDLLTQLINGLEKVERRFALVLDDYHLIHEQAVHTCLVYLLEHLPQSMHLIIATRSDPPLPLARLRAHAEMAELRVLDLCFTTEEAARFFKQVMKIPLQDEQVAELSRRTEGWISGLQLAGISIKDTPDPSTFIQSFSGSNRFILDYLVEEVLDRQTEEMRTFMLKTSILDRLSGALCDAVTELKNSQEILESLERSNLFIIALDQDRSWYRYHQLFLDLLRKQAKQQYPQQVASWQVLASMWCQEHGFLEESIEYSLAAGAFTRAADLVEAAAQPALLRSETYTFRGWVSQLPEYELSRRQDLILYYAWVLALSDAPAADVEKWLMKVDTSLSGNPGKLGVIRGYREFMVGRVQNAVSLLRESLQVLPPGATFFRSVADWLLSLFFVTSGDFQAGNESLEEVVRTNLEKNNLIVAAGALCALAEVHLRLGQLPEAQQDYSRALSVAGRKQGYLPVACRAMMGLGEVWREWNDLEKAARYCRQGIELAASLRQSAAIAGYLTLSRIHHTTGRNDLADEAMAKAWELSQATGETSLDDLYVQLFRTNLETRRGYLAVGRHWMQERSLSSEFDPASLDQKDDYYRYHILKYELLAASRWLIADNQPQTAVQILEKLLLKLEEQGRVHLVIETLLLNALAHQKLGEGAVAASIFERCLALAEPGGYVRIFLDEGQPVRTLLVQAVASPAASPYASRLLEAFEAELPAVSGSPTTGKTPIPQISGILEPLTRRELEILELVARGLSNNEIASRLYLSLPTVKWHTGNIYSKLAVRSRARAIIKARSLGILPSGSVD